ncbi:MAG TPA: NUDIX domain-containing protein [Methanothrix sp.]|nr:NUDIX domain-containing protein [Methanothrix sp.]
MKKLLHPIAENAIMSVNSAGVLLFREKRLNECRLEVLLVHPGGPFWARKDEGAWSIPKGIYGSNEDPLQAAIRELSEETGFSPDCPQGEFIRLGAIRQPSRKVLHAWALRCGEDCGEYDWDRAGEKSNRFTMEWPRGSGIVREFPEIDRAEWFDLPAARRKILRGQAGFLDRLEQHIGGSLQ